MYKYILTLPCLFNNPTIVVSMSVPRNGKYLRKNKGGMYNFEEESISRLSKYNGFIVCFILIGLIGYVNCSKDFSRYSSFLSSTSFFEKYQSSLQKISFSSVITWRSIPEIG